MKKRTRWILIGTSLLLVAGATAYYFYGPSAKAPTGEQSAGRRGGPGGKAPPVTVATAKQGEIDVLLTAIGTITARNTVTVKPRVDGQLIRINFREGQMVKAGDVLAEIDPRPFQVVLDQANGQLAKDQAQLTNAVVDLQRYQVLMAKDSIARQQLDAQDALVRQYQGAVQADRAQVDSARLQLSFTRVTAPAAGRTGLRQVDVGNMVRASDATGVVVITQTQPINAVFAIPADSLGPVVAKLQAGESLSVDAWDREGKSKLASGKLVTVDNQIDTTTGTVKLKAEFANADNTLFPNQFVNIRLQVDTRKDAILIPTAAIQRGTQGTFVYVVTGEEKSIALRPVTLGPATADTVAIDKGLAAGDVVVTDGADKLRPGAKVEVMTAESRAAANNGGGEGGRKSRRGDGAAAVEGGKKGPPPAEAAAPAAAGSAPAAPAAASQTAVPTSAPVAPAAPAATSAGERPRWLDRLPPDVQEKVMKMSPEERAAWIQKRREERAKQADGANQ